MRRFTSSVVLIALAAAAPAAAQAPAPQPEKTIALGVSAGGVDIGGLRLPDARARLLSVLPAMQRPIVVRTARRRFRLASADLDLRLDAKRTVRRAYRAGLEAGGEAIDVRPWIKYRKKAVAAFAARVGTETYRPPREAWLKITIRRLIRHRSKSGRRLQQFKLRARIRVALRDALGPRVITIARAKVMPKVRTRDLPRLYPTVVTIDRPSFTLRLFKRLRYSRSYPVAVGMAGLETPAGLHRVLEKQVNPAWHVPNSDWAGSLAGQVIPGGAPDNPLKARWLGLGGGVGIHGTSEDWSIGTQASHGCIRMHVSDVIHLYDRVPVGAPVLIR